MKYEYGYIWKEYPVDGSYEWSDGSRVQVHDIFNPLPDFMKQADLVFVDPPWNLTNLRTFYTKAELVLEESFPAFYSRLFEVIAEINPVTCYVEIGKEYLPDFIVELRKIFKYVTFYNATYYHNPKNHCYIIRASQVFKKPDFCKELDGMDEQDVIERICALEKYDVIADLCMGQGLVGFYAHKAGKKFVGTELNHKRLSVLRKRIDTGKL